MAGIEPGLSACKACSFPSREPSVRLGIALHPSLQLTQILLRTVRKLWGVNYGYGCCCFYNIIVSATATKEKPIAIASFFSIISQKSLFLPPPSPPPNLFMSLVGDADSSPHRTLMVMTVRSRHFVRRIFLMFPCSSSSPGCPHSAPRQFSRFSSSWINNGEPENSFLQIDEPFIWFTTTGPHHNARISLGTSYTLCRLPTVPFQSKCLLGLPF